MVSFTPTAEYSGPASFTYTIQDNGTDTSANGAQVTPNPRTATATATFTIAEVNVALSANPDVLLAINEDSAAASINLSGLITNDSPGPANESGQSLSVTSVSNGVGGATFDASSKYYFVPDANFNGLASFTYDVTDDGTTNGAADPKTTSSQAFFYVNPINDAPSGVDDTLSTVSEDAAPFNIAFNTLLQNDSKGPANESDQALTVIGVSNAVGGTASIANGQVRFTPASNFNGQASFTYTLQDNGASRGLPDYKTATATARFNVTAVNDAPVITNDLATTAEDTTLVIPIDSLLANDSPGPADESGQYLVNWGFQGSTTAHGGTLEINLDDNTFRYTPPANYSGPDSFTYNVIDGGPGSNNAITNGGLVSITVTPVNDAPTVVTDLKLAGRDTSISFPVADLLANDLPGPADEANQTLTVTGVGATSGNGGTVSLSNGVVTYVPPLNYVGPDAFSYTVQDNGQSGSPLVNDFKSSAGTVLVSVETSNFAPTATSQTLSTTEDGVLPIVLSGSDRETPVSLMRFKIRALPTRGILKANGLPVSLNQGFAGPPANLTYEPGAGNDGAGTDSFDFTVTDNGAFSGTALSSLRAKVSINIAKAVADGAVTIDNDGVVRVGGTSGNDTLDASQFLNAQNVSVLRVRRNGQTISNTIPFTSVRQLRAWGRGGNDAITLNSQAPTFVHAGAGDDTVTVEDPGGVLFGGAGDDLVTSGRGTDMVIGGVGKDRVLGGLGTDILIGGDTAATVPLSNLRQTLNDWATAGPAFANSTTGQLFARSIIDAEQDRLSRGLDINWFIMSQSPLDKYVSKPEDVLTFI